MTVHADRTDLSVFALPDEIAHLAGQINDTDTHGARPIKLWGEIYGSEIDALSEAVLLASQNGVAMVEHPDLVADEVEINAETVWNTKMEKAPGSFDLDRRIAVMDFTGIQRQLIYPDIAAILEDPSTALLF